MTQRVVYDLEVVQVHEEHRHLLLPPPGPGKSVPQAVQEQGPVWQVRQGVVEGLVHEPFLQELALRNVLLHPDEVCNAPVFVVHGGYVQLIPEGEAVLAVV